MAGLEVREVGKRFGGLQALSRVSLTLKTGEILGLIGPNGAGKTTLFAVISGFLTPDEGSVRLNGRELVGLPPHEICRLGLARTFQIVQPFPHLSVLENVMVGAFNRQGKVDEARARALEVLAITRLDRVSRRPAHVLPIGERKRLELARALATGPTVLLLDEVMAGLTPPEVEETVAIIRAIRDLEISILVIEHVMAAVMDCSDRIAVLHHGELIAEGSPGEVARDPKVVDAYWGEPIAAA